MKRALVIQTAFLGDVILTIPVVQALRRRFPESRIDFLCIPGTAPMVKDHPDISRVVEYDKHGRHRSVLAFLRLRGELGKMSYDTVFCPHRSLRSALLSSGTGAEMRIGFDRSAWRRSFTDLLPWKFGMHEVERNLSLLQPLGLEVKREEPRLYPDEESRNNANRFLSAHGVEPPYAVVAPGTVWNTKRYPVESMAEVVRGLLKEFGKVVVIGGKKDIWLRGSFTCIGPGVVSAIGEMPIMSSAELIRRAALLIANDSAPVHIASAFDVPTVAVFGPTVRDFGFFPYHRRSVVVEVQGLSCRPCSIHGGKRCPIKTFDCMRNISPDLVTARAFELPGTGVKKETLREN